jgi:predicted nucleotidyltransferase
LKTVGIVGEYNPFHKGHKLHAEESLHKIGSDAALLCVMSGDFVQRGEPAVFSKFARAEAAVRSGISLVLELPLPWCLSSAEGFCRGAVGLLGSTGVVDCLSFGSEAGELEPLNALAIALLDPAMDSKIRAELERGDSYAAARQRALEKEVGDLAKHLEKPNNILAVEYLKALYDLRLPIEPMTVRRTGAGHDQKGVGELRSASELRAYLGAGRELTGFVPAAALEVYEAERSLGRGPVTAQRLETALLSRLRMQDPAFFREIPDASEGLENRLFTAAREEPSWDAVTAAAKTKRYALSRLRRMALCAALGIRRGMSDGVPPYARVLAADERGLILLRRMAERSTVPIVTKPSAVRELDPAVRRLFELGAAAHDLYVLGFPDVEERRGGADWRGTPKILRGERPGP